MLSEIPNFLKGQTTKYKRCEGPLWSVLVGLDVGKWKWHLEVDSRRSDAQVGRLMLAFSASGLDMRIWELLLLRIDS